MRLWGNLLGVIFYDLFAGTGIVGCVKWLLGSILKNLFSLDSVLKANQVIPKNA
ncbi:PZ18b [Helicobacter pylori Hp A-27]|nr:PZ18b [Helicobacter pylori Hp A-27]